MRRGWETTEFWVSALAIVGLVVASLADALPPRYAAMASAAAAGAYAISRGLAKVNPPKDGS